MSQQRQYEKMHHGTAIIAVMVLCVVIGASTLGSAQSVAIQGGTSTLMDSSGGELQYRWKGVGGFFSAGYQDRLDFGAYVGYKYRGTSYGLGDRTQDFQLATDNFGASRFFYGRGLFVDRKGERDSITAFAGMTTNRFGSMFYDASRRLDTTGAVFFKHENGKFTFYSANIAQDRVTSLQSAGYKITSRITLGATAGVGAGKAYGAVSADYSSRRFDVAAAFVNASKNFETVPGVRLMGSERVGANLRVHAKLTDNLNVTGEHAKMRTLPEVSSTEVAREAVLDSVFASYRWKETQFSGMAATSESGPLWTHTYTATASRRLFSETVTTSAMFLRQELAGREAINSVILSADEKITPQLTLTEGYNRNGSANTFSGGARFVSNFLTFGVGQQLYYSPLAGQNKLANVWTFNFGLRVYRNVRIHADSYVSESGNVRYTFWMDGLRFQRSAQDALPGAGQYSNMKFGKFVVRGVVVDDAGQPVWGVLVRVDGQSAYSDNAGLFVLHFNEGQSFPVTVLPEQSLSPSLYEVVSAPVSVRAETSDSAPIVRIILHKLKLQPAVPPVPAIKKRSANESEGDQTRPGTEAMESALHPENFSAN
jgi:hypothetical protein